MTREVFKKFITTRQPAILKHSEIYLENPGIDPGTSHMLSERFTTWANSPIGRVDTGAMML